jgi:hypothetical protein
MVPLAWCPFCSHPGFEEQETAKTHLRMEHLERLDSLVNGLDSAKRESLVDPYDWAADEFLVQFGKGPSREKVR